MIQKLATHKEKIVLGLLVFIYIFLYVNHTIFPKLIDIHGGEPQRLFRNPIRIILAGYIDNSGTISFSLLYRINSLTILIKLIVLIYAFISLLRKKNSTLIKFVAISLIWIHLSELIYPIIYALVGFIHNSETSYVFQFASFKWILTNTTLTALAMINAKFVFNHFDEPNEAFVRAKAFKPLDIITTHLV